MLSINFHFLDTNILLGAIFPNNKHDNYRICKIYFEKENHNRYISKRVKEESFNVISRERRITNKLIEHVEEYLSKNNIKPTSVESTIHKLKRNFLSSYRGKQFPENIPKDKFENTINDLFNEFYDGFKNDFINQNTNNINIFKKDINKTFRIYSKELNIFIKALKCDEYYKENTYKLLEDSINKTSIHRSDKLILLDYYMLIKTLNQNVGFITQDKGIIKLKQDLKVIFQEINCLVYYLNDHIT
ncbi:MAG: hypothetical protein LBT10_06430 [Methanobrevibacter sp.]|jgi:hypothetical protein|nr:hypothetical protein [Methanobrevibacter sp.]